MKFLDDEKRKLTGFDFVMQSLEVLTPYGIEEKRNIKPFSDGKLLCEELDKVQKTVDSIKAHASAYLEIDSIFKKVRDIRGSLKRSMNYEILDDVDLYEIKFQCILVKELMSVVDGTGLAIDGISLHPTDEVIDVLDPEGNGHPTFYLYDVYSDNLKRIRQEKRSLEQRIRQEKDEQRIRELKRMRLDTVILEEEEELSIRRSLTSRISEYAGVLNDNTRAIGRLDLLMGKARLALKYGGVKPYISGSMEVLAEGMFSPEIDEHLKSRGRAFKPISIRLVSGTTVITGANMGGKSVALKTLALNLLLCQMGFFVFCKRASMPVLDFIYLITDDMQSVARGLSTFAAEIVELKEALEYLKRGRGFLGLDEFARGTNPVEGCNLMQSLCRFLVDYDSISLLSTHYDGIVDDDMVHYQVVGLKNADFNKLKMKIEPDKKGSIAVIQEHMDYSLERVPAKSRVPRDAMNICALLGLEKEVMDIAKQLYDEDDGFMVKEGEHGQQTES